MTETLIDLQLKREEDQVSSGIERYRRNCERKDIGDTDPGAALVHTAVKHVAAAIEKLIEDTLVNHKAGAGHPAVASVYLNELDPVAAAYLTCRMVLQACVHGDKLSTTAMALSQAIEEHYRFDELMVAEAALGSSMERKAKKWTRSSHRRAIMRKAATTAGVRGLEWKPGDKLKLGSKLVEIFIDHTKLAVSELEPEGKNRTIYYLHPTQATSDWLDKMHDGCALLEPRYMPMIVQPKPWTSVVNGGYLTEQPKAKRSFVRDVSSELKDDMLSMNLTTVFDAVNAIQNTGWQINSALFDVMDECWRANYTLGDLPNQDKEDIPARPVDIPVDLRVTDMTEEQKERFDVWRFKASAAHAQNGELVGKRLAVVSKMTMARNLVEFDEFYFPHNVDFRGRVYSIVPDLQPQADDIGKSLLQFAAGKELGESGAYWLCVHVANLFGVDKVSFSDRVQWVNDNSAALLDSAMNPLDGQRFWCDADDPWQALAACFEYAGWYVEGDEYVSHLPIAMDGSCSGLQHFSAMLKDRVGAEAVNLTKTDKPSDIYSEVAKVTIKLLSLETDQLAHAWAPKVTRKIVKRPCMTFAYSVTSRGIRDQIADEMRKEVGRGQYVPGFDNWEAANFIAPIIEAAIRKTVDRAAEAMDWLKGSVKTLLENEMPVTWSTPLGFPVQQRYNRTTSKRYNVWFQGRRVRFHLRHDTKKPDIRKQGCAIAPNFVHSMDACHLMMVANRMVSEGVTHDFAMIHDSFGVHACDVDELHFVIRDEFINLYTDNQLVRFSHHVACRLPKAERDEMIPVPEEGDLDLEEVRDADFFFA